jgi:hypothetical protein
LHIVQHELTKRARWKLIQSKQFARKIGDDAQHSFMFHYTSLLPIPAARAELPGKILKLPRTLAAAETNRQDSGEELKPHRARQGKPGVLVLSHDLVVLRMSTHRFAPILGHSHLAAPSSTPSRPFA